MVFEHASYRTYLKAVLADRIRENPKFSLRAMAKQLEVSPAILSQVMGSKRNFSQRTAYQVTQKLQMPSQEAEYFCLLAHYELEKHPDMRSQLQTKIRNMQKGVFGDSSRAPADLSLDLFKFIADWYHLPIVEMTELTGFNLNPIGVAKKLGISELEAEVAIERLERLGMIQKNEEGRYVKAHYNYEFNSTTSTSLSAAMNQFHCQMLDKAKDATEKQKRNERWLGSNTFSIDPAKLPEAIALANEFRQKMVDLFDQSPKNTETYHLGVQLFKLTKEETV